MSENEEQILPGKEPRRGFFKWYGDQIKNRNTWGKLLFILAPIALIYFLIVGRGMYQPLLIYVRIHWPILLFSGLIIFLFYLGFRKSSKWYVRLSWIIAFTGFSAFVIFFGNGIYDYISGAYIYNNRVTIVELDHPPESIHPKLQPPFVVESYFEETMNNNRQPTPPRTWIDSESGEQFWTGWTEPGNFFWQRYGGEVEEFIQTNVQNPSPVLDQFEREKVSFQCGKNLLFSKQIHNAARKKLGIGKMWTYEVTDMVIGMRDANGNPVQVVPLIKWRGFLFPRPAFGGVIVFDDSKTPMAELIFMGKGEFLSAEEVSKTPWLKDQALLADQTVRFFGESLRFKYGFSSGLPGNHENDHRIPHMDRAFSRLPVIEQFDFSKTNHRETGKGLFYWLELEPYDSTKYGLSMDVFIPGNTTDTIYVFDRVNRLDRSGYKGMSVVVEKIMEDDKSYNWMGLNEGNFIPGGERPFYTYVFPEDTVPEMFYLANVLTLNRTSGKSTSTKAELYLIHAKYDDIIVLLKDEDVYPENWSARIQDRVSTQRRLMRRGIPQDREEEAEMEDVLEPDEMIQEQDSLRILDGDSLEVVESDSLVAAQDSLGS